MEDIDDVKHLVRLLKALGDETRLRLLRLLADQGEQRALCVGALAMRLGVTQSAVSQHLAVLRAVDLVVDERRGYFVHYRLNRARLDDLWRHAQGTLGGEPESEGSASGVAG